jgi:hypothetical protein
VVKKVSRRNDVADTTIEWPGSSGGTYTYWIHEIGTAFKDSPGSYIFAKETSPGRWTPVYIGETNSLKDRLSNHEKMPCVRRHSGTHVHAHTSSADGQVRREEEADLLNKWNPPCNED